MSFRSARSLCPKGFGSGSGRPSAANVALALEDVRPADMKHVGGGWFEACDRGAAPAARYRYVVDGTPMPDPASRYQPDDVHGPSEVIDPDGL